ASSWPVWAALVVASFLVQTHIGTAPTAAAVMVVALVLRGRSRDGGRGRPSRVSRAAVVGLGALVLLWLPPAVDQLGHHTHNVTRLVHFAEHGEAEPRPGLADAVRAIGVELSVLPAGRRVAF